MLQILLVRDLLRIMSYDTRSSSDLPSVIKETHVLHLFSFSNLIFTLFLKPVTCLRSLPVPEFRLTLSIGAIWADLVPTVIALAIYFCIADFVLISQCLYYNHINARRAARHPSIQSTTSHMSNENSPLLTRRRSSDTIGLPGSHRRRSSALSNRERQDTLTKILEDEEGHEGNPWLRNTLSILGVIVVGAAGWVLAWQSGVWKPTGTDIPEMSAEAPFGAEFLGYFSAVCYLGYVLPSHPIHPHPHCPVSSLQPHDLPTFRVVTFKAKLTLAQSTHPTNSEEL
jgi:hypothetical protein